MRSARAVVIDEDRDEALYLLQALGLAGIGAIYFAGDNPDAFPSTPLPGIRVVFLDLKLINQPEVKQYLPYTMNVLQKCVDLVPRTTGIVCWTKHEDEMNAVHAELKLRKIEPAFVAQFSNKAEVIARGPAGIVDTLKQLTALISSQVGHNLLIKWEQFAHDGATQAANTLIRMSADDADLTRLLATIATAASDEAIGTPLDALIALNSGLSSVHADSVESIVQTETGESPFAKALLDVIRQLRNGPPPNLEQRSRLNTFLLAGPAPVFRPGNVYATEPCRIAGIATGKDLRAFIGDVFFSQKAKDDKTWWKKFKEILEKAALPVAIEITPSCDHAAGKSQAARLLAGILIKMDGTGLEEADLRLPAESRLIAKDVEPIWLSLPDQRLEGCFKLLVGARRFLTWPIEEMRKHKPLFRLRYPVVADLQAWFASHAARPGYVSIH